MLKYPDKPYVFHSYSFTFLAANPFPLQKQIYHFKNKKF